MAFGIDDAIAAGLRIIDKVIPDPQAKAAAALEAVKLKQAGEFKEMDAQLQAMQMQASITLEEAKSESLWKSGARPGALWVCVAGLACQFVVGPFFTWAAALAGVDAPFPSLDIETLMGLLAALLGLGVYRTVEKVKGVS